MTDEAFEFGEQSSLRDVNYRLFPPLWSRYDLSEINLQLENWYSIKYLNNETNDYHEDVNLIPNNSGGLYLFWIKCQILPGITEFPFYIGRAQLTKGQNLRKRIKEYFSASKKRSCRSKIKKMFKYWAGDLFVSYIEVEDNLDSVDYEKKLINSLLLPFNSKIPDTEIGQTIQAFPL